MAIFHSYVSLPEGTQQVMDKKNHRFTMIVFWVAFSNTPTCAKQ
jgi:hypothetical protein